jgi:hypothetical protein
MSEAIPSQTGSKLRFVAGALPFFGRYLAAGLGSIFIIPAPWLGTWLLRWLFEKIGVEDGTEITFEGRAGDIWDITCSTSFRSLPSSAGPGFSRPGFAGTAGVDHEVASRADNRLRCLAGGLRAAIRRDAGRDIGMMPVLENRAR